MALRGIKVVELGGLAPVPMCARILADFGARVIKVENPKAQLTNESFDRGKESIVLDLQQELSRRALLRLCSTANVLLDPYRPNVLEKLGLGPTILHQQNPKLIIARLTGYGQPVDNNDLTTEASYAYRSGHDINYVAMSGVLSQLGLHPHPPQAPINLLGDFAGGAMTCAMGVILALYKQLANNNKIINGEVIDVSMTEGCAYIASFLWSSRQQMPWMWQKERGHNILQSGGNVHFYRCYATKDDKFMAVGAIEPKFYADLLKGLEFTPSSDYPQLTTDDQQQNQIIRLFEDKFRSKTRDEWCEIFDKLDACVTPVLSLEEAAQHPLHKSRKSFHNEPNVEPRSCPRLSSDKESCNDDESINSKPRRGQHTQMILKEIGLTDDEIKSIEPINKAKL